MFAIGGMIFLLAAWSSHALAGSCAYEFGSAQTLNFSLPANLGVPRDLPTGTVIATATAFNPSMVVAVCLAAKLGMINSVGAISAPNAGNLFPIGNTGLAYRIKFSWSDYLVSYASAMPLAVGGAGIKEENRFILEIVPIGPVFAGSIPAGRLGAYVNGDNQLTILDIRLVAGSNVTAQTCTVGDMPVNLGAISPTAFKGIGTTASERRFNFTISNCPAGLTKVSYLLHPTSGTVDAAQGIAKLSSTGKGAATGIGVQLKLADAGAVTLDQPMQMTQYNAATGGSYQIPMTAAYYQTAAVVTPGEANAAVVFTMFYE
ncbi:fimbrial protein [Dyella acidiphila]|uniref:Type 1 fimbrial protein n=1 Tax=Dyella acidiphila TaxID=2775866 RepID=A0ABR9G677_9GAMM|nr:fimbrial protein [Dyella acidiphila]MBE1159559.1 type 1 fimbrial protein [Dyella acidiphila]